MEQNVCVCGHILPAHRGKNRPCRVLGCGCNLYRERTEQEPTQQSNDDDVQFIDAQTGLVADINSIIDSVTSNPDSYDSPSSSDSSSDSSFDSGSVDMSYDSSTGGDF